MTNSSRRTLPPTIIIIFGASGDLTARKLVPALFNLGIDDLLPENFHLIGFGRKSISDELFRDKLKNSLKDYSRRSVKDEIWSKMEPHLSFHAGEYDDLNAFVSLKGKIDSIQADLNESAQCIFYLSTPPSGFLPILENLGSSGLARLHQNTAAASKVIVEKPFGRDLHSAR